MSFFAGQIVTAALLNAEQEGSVSVSVASGGSSGTADVTFSPALDDTPTKMQVSLLEAAGSTLDVIVTALSATGMTVKVFNTVGTTVSTNHSVTVFWRVKP